MTPNDSVDISTPYPCMLEQEDLTKYVFVRVQNHLQKIQIDDVQWIHADGNYCYLHFPKKKFALKSSLKRLMARLPAEHFIRVHKSYVVRLTQVDRINIQNSRLSVGEATLPIGRTFRANLMDRINIL